MTDLKSKQKKSEPAKERKCGNREVYQEGKCVGTSMGRMKNSSNKQKIETACLKLKGRKGASRKLLPHSIQCRKAKGLTARYRRES